MVLSILSINYNDNDDKDDVFECFEMTMPEIVSTLTWKKGTKQHVEIPDFVLSKICDENAGCNFECNDNCNGKEKYNNKRIQCKQWKHVKKRDSGIKKGDLVYFLKKDARRMISSSSTQVPSPRNVEVFTA